LEIKGTHWGTQLSKPLHQSSLAILAEMPDRNQVPLNVRVSPTKKDEWKTAIDNDETLAGVVRLAVDRELNDEYVHVDAAEYLDSGDDIDFSEVTTDIDSLSGQVEVMQHQLDNALTPGTMPTEDQYITKPVS